MVSLVLFVGAKLEKTGQIVFLEKRAPTKVKYSLIVCRSLRNFTDEKRENSLSVLRHKISKTLTFSFERAQIT